MIFCKDCKHLERGGILRRLFVDYPTCLVTPRRRDPITGAARGNQGARVENWELSCRKFETLADAKGGA